MILNQDNKDTALIRNLEFKAKEIVSGFLIGQHKSPLHGYSVEFAEHKMYNMGESVRHIDWKLYGRTDKLYQKKYEEETNLRCQIVIDTSSSMHYPKGKLTNKLSFSVYSAAALMQLMIQQRDGVGLSLCSSKIDKHFSAKLNHAHIQYLYLQLSALLEDNQKVFSTTDIAGALHQLAEVLNKRSLVIIFSDMMQNVENMDDIFSALLHLKHRKHDIIVYHTLAYSEELNFDFDTRPYQFIDMETKEVVKVNVPEIKEFYLNSMNAFYHQLRDKCTQYKIDFVPADINENCYQVLQSYLIKRNKIIKT